MYTDRHCGEFIKGVHSFLNVAEENTRNGFMCCPCGVCQNEKDYSSSRILHTHLFRSGFKFGYNYWIKHGERGVMMEHNEEEENDDNYPMYSEYGGTTMENNKEEES
jgi:hypothetical protein